MTNPFNISEDKLKILISAYEAWLKSDPKEEKYPETIRLQSKKIKEEFLDADVLSVMSDEELYNKIFKYSRSLEGPVYIRLGEPRLKGDLQAIRRNLMYVSTSNDTPFMVAQNILEGDYKISIYAKAFWSPILLARFPDILPNWNNKTENFLKRFKIIISTSKLSITERYKILSDAFMFLNELASGHDFYTINHLMHFGTVIKEGSDLIARLQGENLYDPIAEMINNYKEKIKKDGLKDELYKWKLIKTYRGRPDTSAPDFREEITSIDYKNLVYYNAARVRNHIASKLPEEYRSCLIKLFDENTDLTKRINEFIAGILSVYRKVESQMGSHHDERTTATILTFHNPLKYTFYKDSFYRRYCTMLSVAPKTKGEKYAHYLELILDLIRKYISQDLDLINLANSFMDSECFEDSNHLILAQDILFQMLGSEEEVNEKKTAYEPADAEDQLIRKLKQMGCRDLIERHFILLEKCIKQLQLEDGDLRLSFSITDKDYLSATINQRYFITSEVEKGDSGKNEAEMIWLMIPFSFDHLLEDHDCFIKRSDKGGFKSMRGETSPPLWIAFNPARLINDNQIIEIWLSAVRSELERSEKSGFRQHHNSAYFNAVADPEYRKILFTRAFGSDMHNMNIILYGPPGTGKTYKTVDLAVKITAPDEYTEGEHTSNKVIYERLVQSGQIAFTTFHQSMNYEDFIEGIKPSSDDSSGLSYSVEDGIFKQLAVNAAFEYVGEKSSDASKSLNFSYVYDQLLDEVTEKIGKEEGYILSLKSGSKIEVVEITSASNFLVRHKNGSRTYTVSRRRLERLFTELPDLDTISNINEEIRKIIGGSNASAYWTVLRKLRSFKGDFLTSVSGKKYSYEDKAAAVEKLQPEDVIITGNEKKYVLIIDEINRGNVSQIFGELITLIEDDKRFGKGERLSAVLPYSRSRFFVPPNLYIIGTMNTADRSVEALDTALRRRYSFIEMVPEYDLPSMEKEIAGVRISELLETLNNRIEKLIDRDHRIGHSYFLGLNSTEDLMTVFRNKVIPLFQEYFYGNYEKMGLVLGKGFIEKLPDEKVRFASFPADENDFNDRVIYRMNRDSIEDPKIFEQAITHLLNWQ